MLDIAAIRIGTTLNDFMWGMSLERGGIVSVQGSIGYSTRQLLALIRTSAGKNEPPVRAEAVVEVLVHARTIYSS